MGVWGSRTSGAAVGGLQQMPSAPGLEDQIDRLIGQLEGQIAVLRMFKNAAQEANDAQAAALQQHLWLIQRNHAL